MKLKVVRVVIDFYLHKIYFKSGHSRKNRVKKTINLMTSSRDENVINFFKTFIFKRWGLKLLYLLWFRSLLACKFGSSGKTYIYVICMYRCLHQTLL